MEIKKVGHIGIGVTDLESAKGFYTKTLGLNVGCEEALDGMKIAFIRVGEVNLELIQSVADGGVIGKFIAKRGEGVHDIAYEVEDVSSALEDLKAQGVELVDEAPRRVAHGKEVAFVHPKSSYGVLTELVCKKRRMQNA